MVKISLFPNRYFLASAVRLQIGNKANPKNLRVQLVTKEIPKNFGIKIKLGR
jgi:hypothetical protein